MAVAFRSSSQTAEAKLTSVDVPIPSGAAAGDIALVAICHWESFGAFPTITAPSGFAQAATITHTSGSSNRTEVYRKRLTTAETGSWTFTWSTSTWTTAFAELCTGGVTSGEPIEATDTATGSNSGAYPTTSLTTTSAAFLGHFARHDGGSGAGTPPTNFTEAEDGAWAKANYRALSASGAVSASGGTIPSGDPVTVVLVAVRAEPDASTPAEVTTSIPLSLLLDANAATAHSITADIPLDLALTGTAQATHEATATVPLGLALTATSQAAHEVTASIPLTLDVDATSQVAHEVTASIPLDVDLTATADAPTVGTANVTAEIPLSLALSATTQAEYRATATIPLALALAATTVGLSRDITVTLGPITSGWGVAEPVQGWGALDTTSDQWAAEDVFSGWQASLD